MYPRFIEVHGHTGFDHQGEYIPVSLNAGKISVFNPREEGTEIVMDNGDFHVITEDYNTVKKMIIDAGCHIEKADPRLDVSRPVEWDELTRTMMIGQPVWNSNSRRWMLLIDVNSMRDGITLLDDCGGQHQWTEHEAKAMPLYRMRME